MDKVGMVKKEVQMQNWSEAELVESISAVVFADNIVFDIHFDFFLYLINRSVGNIRRFLFRSFRFGT